MARRKIVYEEPQQQLFKKEKQFDKTIKTADFAGTLPDRTVEWHMRSSSLTIYADAAKDDAKSQQDAEKGAGDAKNGAENGGGEDEAGEAEEQEEPEDFHPTLREECSNSAKCIGFKKHFQHCQEKVESGEGFKGEDCVEEIMMHCADHCAAPKLFSKLR